MHRPASSCGARIASISRPLSRAGRGSHRRRHRDQPEAVALPRRLRSRGRAARRTCRGCPTRPTRLADFHHVGQRVVGVRGRITSMPDTCARASLRSTSKPLCDQRHQQVVGVAGLARCRYWRVSSYSSRMPNDQFGIIHRGLAKSAVEETPGRSPRLDAAALDHGHRLEGSSSQSVSRMFCARNGKLRALHDGLQHARSEIVNPMAPVMASGFQQRHAARPCPDRRLAARYSCSATCRRHRGTRRDHRVRRGSP